MGQYLKPLILFLTLFNLVRAPLNLLALIQNASIMKLTFKFLCLTTFLMVATSPLLAQEEEEEAGWCCVHVRWLQPGEEGYGPRFHVSALRSALL